YYAASRDELADKSERLEQLAEREREEKGKAQEAGKEQVRLRRVAEDAADESGERLGRYCVENGLRLVGSDPTGALLWFAEAPRADGDNPARREVHRMRLAAYLRLHARPVHILEHPGLEGISASPDGRRLLTRESDSAKEPKARLWDLVTGQPVGEPMPYGPGNSKNVAPSRDGHRRMTVSAEGARVWDTATGKPLTPPLKGKAPVSRAVLSDDGRRLVTVGRAEGPY